MTEKCGTSEKALEWPPIGSACLRPEQTILGLILADDDDDDDDDEQSDIRTHYKTCFNNSIFPHAVSLHPFRTALIKFIFLQNVTPDVRVINFNSFCMVMFKEKIKRSLSIRKAVSYTHLDVYKRQIYHNDECYLLTSLLLMVSQIWQWTFPTVTEINQLDFCVL